MNPKLADRELRPLGINEEAIRHQIQVTYEHQVYFTRNLFDLGNVLLREVLSSFERQKALVFVDSAVAEATPQILRSIRDYFEKQKGLPQLVSSPTILPGGEQGKNSARLVRTIYRQIDKHHLCRHSFIFGIGGGALLDVIGFAASTAHRGIRHVRVPTTTLSQADGGVGIKNGLNLFDKKNMIGSFNPPFAVIIDYDFLKTLPEREKRCGYSEAVKVALVRDAAFFTSIEENAPQLRVFNEDAMQWLVRRCAELHLEHIATSGDPFELTSARPLDFGHWIAHKLEVLSEFKINHGEAVAMGMAIDAIYSKRMGLLEEKVVDRVLQVLENLGFELFAEELLNPGPDGRFPILKGLEEFRQHLGGKLSITLLRGIGIPIQVHEMNAQEVVKSIFELRRRVFDLKVPELSSRIVIPSFPLNLFHEKNRGTQRSGTDRVAHRKVHSSHQEFCIPRI